MPRPLSEIEGSRQSAQLKLDARRVRNNRIAELYRDGMQIIDIAKRMSVHPKTVKTVVSERYPGALTDTRGRA